MLLFMLTVETPKALDEQLNDCIKKMADGDADALEELYRLTHKGVYAYALSVVKNPHDAGDVMQETFVNAFYNAGGYKDMGKPMAWLITIARNLCYAHLRRKENLGSEDESLELLPQPGDSFEQIENSQLLQFCLSALAEEERQILVLHTVWGLRHREIASLLSMNLSTVLSKYRRSLHKCKQFLVSQQGGTDYEK